MFNLLTPKPDAVLPSSTIIRATISKKSPTMLAATLAGALLLSGCQQQPAPAPEENTSQTSEQERAEANKPAPQSDSAAARIEQFQPLYVAQAQGLQRRLQAEYESLQAADTADSQNASLLNNGAKSTEAENSTLNKNDTLNKNNASGTDSDNNSNNDPAAPVVTEEATVTATKTTTETAAANADVETDAEINTSTEVGERDLEVLKRISLEPHKPKILTEEQIIEHYQQAMQALYQPAATELGTQEANTLLNIATLVPQLFEHAEISERVMIKSPALARLIVQHQVWQQIEIQQALDMQQMKQTQQQEFETLMTKFNDTIEGYDEQIAKYEQTLKEFQ